MKLVPIITSNIDFKVLAQCVDMTEIDKKSSKPLDKLSSLASSMLCLDPSHQWLSVTFYFELPSHIVDMLVCSGYLKVAFRSGDLGLEGFISGSIEDYAQFVLRYLTRDAVKQLRVLANLLYTYFSNTYGIFSNIELIHLPDKTFVLA